MCLTPDKDSSSSSSDSTTNNAATVSPDSSGAGATQQQVATHPADSTKTVDDRAASSTTSSSTTESSATKSATSVSSVKKLPSVLIGRKSSFTTPVTSSSTPTLKPKGGLTSSLASKFSGNTAVFPKLGVGGVTLPTVVPVSIPRKLSIGSIKRLEISSNNSSPKIEFNTIKLKKVSKYSEDKPRSTDSTTKLNESGSNSPPIKSSKESICKNSESSKLITEEKSADSSSTDSSSSNHSNSKNSSGKSEKSAAVVIPVTVTDLEVSKNISEIESQSKLYKEKSFTQESFTRISDSSTFVKKLSVERTKSSTRESSVTVVSSNKSVSSSVSSCESSVTILKTSTAISANLLCRSTTIKSSDIPGIAIKTEEADNNSSLAGDTEIKVTTSVKKVKKSTDGIAKKKKKKVTNESDGTEIPVIQECDTEVTTIPVTNQNYRAIVQNTAEHASVDRKINIEVLPKDAVEKGKTDSEATIVNGLISGRNGVSNTRSSNTQYAVKKDKLEDEFLEPIIIIKRGMKVRSKSPSKTATSDKIISKIGGALSKTVLGEASPAMTKEAMTASSPGNEVNGTISSSNRAAPSTPPPPPPVDSAATPAATDAANSACAIVTPVAATPAAATPADVATVIPAVAAATHADSAATPKDSAAATHGDATPADVATAVTPVGSAATPADSAAAIHADVAAAVTSAGSVASPADSAAATHADAAAAVTPAGSVATPADSAAATPADSAAAATPADSAAATPADVAAAATPADVAAAVTPVGSVTTPADSAAATRIDVADSAGNSSPSILSSSPASITSAMKLKTDAATPCENIKVCHDAGSSGARSKVATATPSAGQMSNVQSDLVDVYNIKSSSGSPDTAMKSSNAAASAAAMSIPCTVSPSIAIPASLSSSPSVCSLSTATDTLSTSISTSTSDLSISPPLVPPSSSSSSGAGATCLNPPIAISNTMSTSTTTLSTSSYLGASGLRSTASGAGISAASAAARDSSYIPSILLACDEDVTIIVRDMSSVSRCINRTNLQAPASSTIACLFVEVGHKFCYEPDSFSLTLQNNRTVEQVELERVDPSRTLFDAGFIADGVSRNSLLLSDLHRSPPKTTSSDAAGSSREDELALGASASPTSCGEDSGMYSSSSTTGTSSRKKHTWQDQDTVAASSSSAGTSSHEYTNYTYCSSASSCKQDTGYVGLVNQAMTCYLNSLLQTLYMTPEFRNALYRWEFKGSKEEGYKSIPYQLQKLFLLLQTADRSAVETTRLTRSFGWDSSEAWQQHDIQELCRVMFEALEQSFANTDQANFIDTLYQGKMKDYVQCLVCDNENARMDSFLDIPLPIRPFGSSTAYQSLEEALKAFVTPELLDGNNQYQCSRCNAMCDAHKGLKFTSYPYLLTIHLKRFDFDYQTFHRIKLNDRVTFPNQLDLLDFLDNMESSGMQCSSSKSDSATSALDDAATDDSGSALDTEDSLVDYTPPHNTTQEEDEGIDLGVSDNERNSYNDKKTTKKTHKEKAATVGQDGKEIMTDNNSAENKTTETPKEKLNVDNAVATAEKDSLHSSAKSSDAVDNSQEQLHTTYQLFSIMIHSGSASGGHYYAYIKDFESCDWFCFNDQSVTRISDDDIKRTYGSGRGSGSGFAASANAYMLMYRQCNEEMNVLPFTKDTFPGHIKKLCETLNEEEEQEREARERERCTCVIKLYCHHQATAHLSDLKLRVHKDATLAEATKQAHQALELYKVVPVERCRLVKYEEYNDSLECSFEDMDDKAMSEVLGGVKPSYKFDLLMEVREEHQKFEVYRPGGLMVKVFIVNLSECGEVDGPYIVRGSLSMTVGELKQTIGRSLSLKSECMRIAVEGFYNEMKLLADSYLQLRSEGFYRSSKVFVEASGDESTTFYAGSAMASIVDRYQNTITLYCNLPQVTPAILSELNIPPYVDKTTTPPQETKQLQHGKQERSPPCSTNSAVITSTVTSIPSSTVSSRSSSNDSCNNTTTSSSSSSSSSSSISQQKHNLTLPVPSSSSSSDGASTTATFDTPSSTSLNTSISSDFSAVSSPSSVLCSTASSSASLATSATAATADVTSTSYALAEPAAATTVSSLNGSSSIAGCSSGTPGNSISLGTGGGSCGVMAAAEGVSPSTVPAVTSTTVASLVAVPSTSASASVPSAIANVSAAAVAGTSAAASAPQSSNNLSDGEDDENTCGGGYSSAFNSDQSTSEDSSLTSDSDRTLVGDPPEEDRLSDRCNSPDYHNVSSPEEGTSQVVSGGGYWCSSSGTVAACIGLDDAIGGGDGGLTTDIWGDRCDDQPIKRYFKARLLAGSDNPDERVLEMRVDKRMTVDQLKEEIQPVLRVSVEHFKLYKKYIQEFECSRGGEQVKQFGDSGRLIAKLDRALLEGEYRGKVYKLDATSTTEPAKFLIDFILRTNDTVGAAKVAIVKEIASRCKICLDVENVRLRRKSWKNPQQVYLDTQVFSDRDISLHNNWELFIQERAGPEAKTGEGDELLLFTRRWRPSQYKLDAITEILVPLPTAACLRTQLSQLSGIPVERVEFAKGRNTFPHDVSVLDISTELDWSFRDELLDARHYTILDDGALVYYRDKDESLKELCSSERMSLQIEENRRLNRDSPHSSAPVVSIIKPPREKGLKIYFNSNHD